MFAVPLFSTLLEWLASATGDMAKNDSVPTLDFPLPAAPPTQMRLTPTRPMERWCCQMGQVTTSGDSLLLDPSTLWNAPHRFRARVGHDLAARISNDGGTIGFVYTRHGGFIDLGHARDFIDHTNYFAETYRQLAINPDTERAKLLWNEGADMHLFAEKAPSLPDLTTCAFVGAKLAFDYSIWHEIQSYFALEKYSSFAPEDVFSNAVGVLTGFRALFNPTIGFDGAAHLALKEVLELLGPAKQEITQKATEYVKDRWWRTTLSQTGETLRRNFLVAGAIKPWLVTDLSISGREAAAEELRNLIGKPASASITIPTHHNGTFLNRHASLVFKNLPRGLRDLTGLDEIKSSNLLAVSVMLRDHARLEEGRTIDQP